MAKPDGRIEKGQRLSTAISARAWNRAQDAADIVLGARPGVEARGPTDLHLPALRANLPIKGHFGQVAFYEQTATEPTVLAVSQPPAAPATAWPYSTDEKFLPAFGQQMLGDTAVPQWRVLTLDFVRANLDLPMAICVDNDSHTWAVSGYAICRVRVFNRNHRYARLSMQFPGSTNAQDVEAAGCLDSAFFGPAKVLGYARVTQSPPVGATFSHSPNDDDPAWPSFVFRWALVRF